MKDYRPIFTTAAEIAKDHALETHGEDVMKFSCGFAWVKLKVKKNDPIGKELEKQGLMQWDDFHKHYYIWIGDYNQSVDHKEEHAKAMAKILKDRVHENFGWGSRMD